jgi:hypothetical protein
LFSHRVSSFSLQGFGHAHFTQVRVLLFERHVPGVRQLQDPDDIRVSDISLISGWDTEPWGIPGSAP